MNSSSSSTRAASASPTLARIVPVANPVMSASSPNQPISTYLSAPIHATSPNQTISTYLSASIHAVSRNNQPSIIEPLNVGGSRPSLSGTSAWSSALNAHAPSAALISATNGSPGSLIAPASSSSQAATSNGWDARPATAPNQPPRAHSPAPFKLLHRGIEVNANSANVQTRTKSKSTTANSLKGTVDSGLTPIWENELLALKVGSRKIREAALLQPYHSVIELSEPSSRIALIHASYDRRAQDHAIAKRVSVQNVGREVGQVGGLAWIFNGPGKAVDSYDTLAKNLDSLGADAAKSYTGAKRGKYTPGQFAAHAVLLAFKGKEEKLFSEFGFKESKMDELKKHAAVLLGAEPGRAPIAAISNYLMLHQMKHTPGSSFSGDSGTLTRLHNEQLSTHDTKLDTNSFLSAPYGSLKFMGDLQRSIDAFPEGDIAHPADHIRNRISSWRSAFSPEGTNFPEEEKAKGGYKKRVIKPVYKARGDNGTEIDLAMPKPLDVADNEALRLKKYVDRKSKKHPDRVNPQEALNHGVLKYFTQPLPLPLPLPPLQMLPEVSKRLEVTNPSTAFDRVMAQTNIEFNPQTHAFRVPTLTSQPMKIFDIRHSNPTITTRTSNGINDPKSAFGQKLQKTFSSRKRLF
jgi:hypothetical protein